MTLYELFQNLIDTECIASQLYEKIAYKTKDEITETALSFAKEEEKHAVKLKELLSHLENPKTLIPSEIIPLMSLAKEKLDIFKIEEITRKQLFLLALQLEKESVLLYEEIAKIFNENTEGRNLFSQLVEEERRHMYFILMRLHEMK